jgi:hypothetical protein
MWRKANLRRWATAFRRNPEMGVAGFAVGLLYGAAATSFEHWSGHRYSLPFRFLLLQNVSPIIVAAVGLAAFIWLAGTLRLPQKRGIIFVVCIFPGAMVELLLSAIVGTITRMIA